jgi:hypothetical protein
MGRVGFRKHMQGPNVARSGLESAVAPTRHGSGSHAQQRGDLSELDVVFRAQPIGPLKDGLGRFPTIRWR